MVAGAFGPLRSHQLGGSLRCRTPPPLAGARILRAHLHGPAVSSPGKGCQAPGGTFILAKRRERCSQARERRTEPFCLDFSPRYSNRSIRTKMRPPWTMARPPASRPGLPPPDRSQGLPRSSAAQRLSGRERPRPHPARFPRSFSRGQAGAPGRRGLFSLPGLMPHAGRGRAAKPPGRARELPRCSSPRDCRGSWMAPSSTKFSFFQA